MKSKYSDTPVKVSIQQNGLEIKMIIETPEGKKEEILKTLHEYGLVISGQMRPEDFLASEIQIMELRQQLRISMLQLENKKELIALQSRNYDQALQRLDNLERNHEKLLSLVGQAFFESHYVNSKLIQTLDQLSDRHSEELKEALTVLKLKILNGLNADDALEVKQSLSGIQSEDKNLFESIKDFALSTISSTTGSYLYEWILAVTSVLPK